MLNDTWQWQLQNFPLHNVNPAVYTSFPHSSVCVCELIWSPSILMGTSVISNVFAKLFLRFFWAQICLEVSWTCLTVVVNFWHIVWTVSKRGPSLTPRYWTCFKHPQTSKWFTSKMFKHWTRVACLQMSKSRPGLMDIKKTWSVHLCDVMFAENIQEQLYDI